MTPSHTLTGDEPAYRLPVTLSKRVRRDLLIASGLEPEAVQYLYVGRLTEIDDTRTRRRLVDLWDKLDVVEIDEGEYVEGSDGEAYEVRPPAVRTRSYEWLHRTLDGEWTRFLPGTEGESIDANNSFHAEMGRTVTAVELLRMRHRTTHEGLAAMLNGAPMVDLMAGATLTLADVLTAYDSALGLARELVELIDSGVHDRSARFEDFVVLDEAIFIYPGGAEVGTLRPVALLKAADPDAFTRAREIVATVQDNVVTATRDAANLICRRWQEPNWRDLDDAAKVESLIENYVRNAAQEMTRERRTREDAQLYERARTAWISRHGSDRLRRAVDRGYKHDGIYRDERAAIELPGFITSVGRQGKSKELINPSDEALAMERAALARAEALGLDDGQVRLVYVEPGLDSEWWPGEFVQITGYLGRHTLWRSVSGQAGDRVPF